MLDTKITASFFSKENNIGIEGTISPSGFEQYSLEIEKSVLQKKIELVTKCISPSLNKRYNWEDEIKSALNKVLGDKDFYNIKKSIKSLQIKAKNKNLSPIEKLVERTLWLVSFDGVDPRAVSKVNLLKMFNGLHIDEPSIQPELRWGGGTNHMSMRIYLGPEKFIRIHIYPESNTPDNVSCIDLAHEHDGSSAGIILTGEIVNQHYKLDNLGEGGKLPLYFLKNSKHAENLNTAGRVNRVFERIGSTNPVRISSHVYKAGDMYFFNGSTIRDKAHVSKLKHILDSDLQTSHNVASRGFTLTFFTNHTPKNSPDTYALFPPGSPDLIEVFYNSKKRTISFEKSIEILEEACIRVNNSLLSRNSLYPSTPFDRIDKKTVNIIKNRLDELKIN